jgi:hypothetical protein
MASILNFIHFRKGIIPNLYFALGFAGIAYGNPMVWTWLLILPFLVNVVLHNKLLSLFLGMVMFVLSAFFMLAWISDVVKADQPIQFIVGGTLFVGLSFVMSGWLVKDAKLD